jgi:hypothetical protein
MLEEVPTDHLEVRLSLSCRANHDDADVCLAVVGVVAPRTRPIAAAADILAPVARGALGIELLE